LVDMRCVLHILYSCMQDSCDDGKLVISLVVFESYF
jgi:hypothetical protein